MIGENRMKIKTAIRKALKIAKSIAKERKCDSHVSIFRKSGSYEVFVYSSDEVEWSYEKMDIEDIFAKDWVIKK